MDKVRYMDINEYMQYMRNSEKRIAEEKKGKENFESKKRDLESQLQDSKNNSSRRDSWISDLEYKIKEKQKEMDKFTPEYIEGQKKLGFSEKEIMQGYYTREDSIDKLESDIEKHRDEQKEFSKETEKLQDQLRDIENEIARTTKTIEDIEKDIANLIIEWNKFNMEKVLNNPGVMLYDMNSLQNSRTIEEDIIKKLPKSLENEVRKHI